VGNRSGPAEAGPLARTVVTLLYLTGHYARPAARKVLYKSARNYLGRHGADLASLLGRPVLGSMMVSVAGNGDGNLDRLRRTGCG
jgi:hypothetical protein